ncbi:MAG: recombination regulator RecX [Casimicrobiaceae bacterium]
MTRETTLRERALRLLTRRDHARLELQRKLAPFAASPEALDALLEELSADRLLSDDRYAEGRAHVLSRRFGSVRIAHELKNQGVSGDVLERVVAGARLTELDRAREVWRKRFGEPARNAQERAKQFRFLQNRGFGLDVIRQVIRGVGDDDQT